MEVLTEHVADDDELVGILAGATVAGRDARADAGAPEPPRAAARPAPGRHHRQRQRVHRPGRGPGAAASPCAAPESSPTPPGELTWALILGLARHVAQEDAAFHAGGPWQSTVGRDLAGATLGLVGLGKIGTRVAPVARAFGMDVIAWSPHLTEERAAAGDARLASSLPALMAASDWVSLHLVLADATRGIVGREEIAAMKPSAYLVNTSRAGLVDTDALVEALEAGRIAGAGLDVYDVEPVPAGRPSACPRQRAGHAAPRLRDRRQLPQLLPRGGRGHRRLAGRGTGPGPGLDRQRPRVGHMNSRVIALSVAMLLGLSACAKDDTSTTTSSGVKLVEDGTLTICTHLPYEPFEFTDSGKVVGFDIDVLTIGAKAEGLDTNVVDIPWETIVSGEALNTGQCDVAAGAMTINEEREAVMDFTDPYFEATQALITKTGSGFADLSDLRASGSRSRRARPARTT